MKPSAKIGSQYLTKDELVYIAEAVSAYSGGDAKMKASIIRKIRPQEEEVAGESQRKNDA